MNEKEQNKIIYTYRWGLIFMCSVLLLVFLEVGIFQTIIVPYIIRGTIKSDLDNRHGVLIQQLQDMLDQEFKDNLYRIKS